MARHSKWHNIQVRKGKQDKVRANVFTKLARLITIAAQRGGGDPETNFSLRLALEKARADNLPKDNIDRAIKRGTGELADEAALEEILYEGFGPGGVGMLVETVTNNRNRTVGELKQIFSSHGGSLGGAGSVQWMFQRCGVVRFAKNKEAVTAVSGILPKGGRIMNQEFELRLIEAGADDIIEIENRIEILCPVEKLQSAVETVRSFGVEPSDSGLEWVVKETAEASADVAEKVGALVEELEEHDDVKMVYTSAGYKF